MPMYKEWWLNSKCQDNEIQKLIPIPVPSLNFSLGDIECTYILCLNFLPTI